MSRRGYNYKSGIVKSDTDKAQPYRVWHKGFIVWFAHTLKEAELKLKEAQKK